MACPLRPLTDLIVLVGFVIDTARSTFRNMCLSGADASIDTSSNSCCCNSGLFNVKSNYKRLPWNTKALPWFTV